MQCGLPNQSANLFGFEPIKQKDFALLVAQFLETTTMEISASETKNRFGKTVFEALTSSTPVTTKHKEWRLGLQATAYRSRSFSRIDHQATPSKILIFFLEGVKHIFPPFPYWRTGNAFIQPPKQVKHTFRNEPMEFMVVPGRIKNTVST